MNPYVLEYIEQNKELLIEKWMKEITSVREEQRLQMITNEVYLMTNRKFALLLIESMPYQLEERSEQFKLFAKEQIQLGWPLQYLTKGLQIFKKVLMESIQEMGSNHQVQNIDVYQEIQNWIDSIIDQLISEYTGNWETTSTLQKLALRELSAPLIPVFDGISVMPLIGTIDTERARLIMENLLNGVIKYESEVVLIDITGVPIVDTMVAHHLIQASEAVRLVGAKAILVGIRPEIAQTIVNLGIQLGKFQTTSTLRKGIQEALAIQGKEIIQIQDAKC
ncbi:STAS domain-containing protein [Caldalkalibacillus mannanilyticus]|uniref:STAS domain-containing protein n=1 Tax=Caldalkalibacillus mannanilyticus TaxID=1418 RepID=UPI00046ADEE9|nr:STAS domain-containing protein [Caldalkalibacillus mannanilyticus]